MACVGGEEHDERTSLALVVEMVARTGTRGHWKYAAADAVAAAAAAGAAGQDNSITIDSLSYITTYWFNKYSFAFGRQFYLKQLLLLLQSVLAHLGN